MGLRDLELKPAYDSEEDDIVNEFYIPVLSESVLYRRLAGFFSSTTLAIAARGISSLIVNGGKIELVVGAILNKDDVEAIKEGTESPEHVIENFMIKDIDQIENEFVKNHVKALAWMIAQKRLEIKVAILVDNDGFPLDKETAVRRGLFHLKVGILKDKMGDVISFSGSVNESAMGWRENIEEIKVFRSWADVENIYLEKDWQKFEKYWYGASKSVRVIDIPKAVEKKLIEIAPERIDELRLEEFDIYRADHLKKEKKEIEISRWVHQEKAQDIFLSKKHGVLEMATGTGKTRVAINIMNHLLEKGKINGAIVTTFGNDLLDQWHNELLQNCDLTIYRYYDEFHELQDFIMNPSSSILLLNWENLHEIIDNEEILHSKLLICDEVHGFGSESNRKKLSGKLNKVDYRLGLSATPEREYDEIGRKFIEDEIGPVIFEFGLTDAIKMGILCEFDYIPLTYHLSSEDKKSIQLCYKKFHGIVKSGGDPNKLKKKLYMCIARARKISESKLPIFEEFIKGKKELLNNCIIFVEEMEYGKLVQDIIINYNPDYHTYYADDEKSNLLKFSRGEISLLITCKRISQGIDIRSVQNIILFSASRARLETIQRIGRCLRLDPRNPNKRATVVDFIVDRKDDSDEDYEDTDEARRNWLSDISKTKRVLVINDGTR